MYLEVISGATVLIHYTIPLLDLFLAAKVTFSKNEYEPQFLKTTLTLYIFIIKMHNACHANNPQIKLNNSGDNWCILSPSFNITFSVSGGWIQGEGVFLCYH